MKIIRIVIIMICICFFYVSLTQAYVQEFVIDGYDLIISGQQIGDALEVSGWISGGEPCGKLEIYIQLHSTRGAAANILCIVNDVGGDKEKAFQGYDRVDTYVSDNWTVSEISVNCVSD